MKTLAAILLFALVVPTNGCMTYSAVKRAKGEQNGWTGRGASEPEPAYYALVPLAVPADIATSPFQLILYLVVASSGVPL